MRHDEQAGLRKQRHLLGEGLAFKLQGENARVCSAAQKLLRPADLRVSNHLESDVILPHDAKHLIDVGEATGCRGAVGSPSVDDSCTPRGVASFCVLRDRQLELPVGKITETIAF